MENKTIVTKDQFAMFEWLRKSGRFNMMESVVRDIIGISREQQIYIIENYTSLLAEFDEQFHGIH